ncbi:hypothetical protein [Sphingobium lactosutens]|uniref:hypothetical protein n=1 Tax=Sphingobium lactosutens TaxID=522773 RepID=UPI0015C1BC53|nr:hypothetical protein [Sphingobium lactosutens]
MDRSIDRKQTGGPEVEMRPAITCGNEAGAIEETINCGADPLAPKFTVSSALFGQLRQ